jgi:hypothetical protein
VITESLGKNMQEQKARVAFSPLSSILPFRSSGKDSSLFLSSEPAASIGAAGAAKAARTLVLLYTK